MMRITLVGIIAVALLAGNVPVCAEPVGAQRNTAAQEYSFPPEWAPHDAIWMAWSGLEAQQAVQVEMVRAMSPHVLIRMMVRTEEERKQAERVTLDAGINAESIEFVIHETYNFWTRDAGPRFLSDGKALAIADFAWDAYGYPNELRTGLDTGAMAKGLIDNDLAGQMGMSVVSSPVVAEGGGLEVSSDVLLAYRETAMQRNPGTSLEDIEREYLRLYGKKKIAWLGRSPLADRVFSGPKFQNYFGWGANGHIDEYVRFVSDTTIVIARIEEEDAALDALSAVDREILAENLAELRELTDIDGNPFRIVTLPSPALHRYMWTGPLPADAKAGDTLGAWYRSFAVGDEIHWIPALSYLNFVITNELILVPAYWQEGSPVREREKDEEVRGTLQELFPGREIVQINPLPLNWAGGGMHCITQQQPALR